MKGGDHEINLVRWSIARSYSTRSLPQERDFSSLRFRIPKEPLQLLERGADILGVENCVM
jgi:hypothetical protein